ncbi:hypothetical protein BJX64DRAFT_283344 [Aspergillus heterothallicus]
MISGTAYRCTDLAGYVLTPKSFIKCPFRQPGEPYKAPQNKASKHHPWAPNPLVDRLPLEMLHSILLSLDLISLGNLRRVNKAARHAVESLRAYSLLVAHASDTLRVMHATECTSYFAIGDIYNELCYPWCRTCLSTTSSSPSSQNPSTPQTAHHEFAPLLYLPTLTRSCYKCNLLHSDHLPARLSDICIRFGLTARDLSDAGIPRILTRVSDATSPYSRQHLVDVSTAQALAIKIHGSFEAVTELYRARVTGTLSEYRAAVAQWEEQMRDWVGAQRMGEESNSNSNSNNNNNNENKEKKKKKKQKKKKSSTPRRRPRRPRRPEPPTPLEKKLPSRFLEEQGAIMWRLKVTAAFPYFDRATQTAETGVYCRACTYHWEEGHASDRPPAAGRLVSQKHPPSLEAYFRAFRECDIAEHFAVCENVGRGYDFGIRGEWMGRPQRDGEDFVVRPF